MSKKKVVYKIDKKTVETIIERIYKNLREYYKFNKKSNTIRFKIIEEIFENIKANYKSLKERNIENYLDKILTKLRSSLKKFDKEDIWVEDIKSLLFGLYETGEISKYHIDVLIYFLKFYKEYLKDKKYLKNRGKKVSFKERDIDNLINLLERSSYFIKEPSKRDWSFNEKDIIGLFEVLYENRDKFGKEEYEFIYYFIRALLESGSRIEHLINLLSKLRKSESLNLNEESIIIHEEYLVVIITDITNIKKDTTKKQLYFPLIKETYLHIIRLINEKNFTKDRIKSIVEKFRKLIKYHNKNNKMSIYLTSTRKFFQHTFSLLNNDILLGALIEGRGLEEEISFKHYIDHINIIKEKIIDYYIYIIQKIYKNLFLLELKNKGYRSTLFFSIFYDFVLESKFSKNILEKLNISYFLGDEEKLKEIFYEEILNEEGDNLLIIKYRLLKENKLFHI